ncbi:MAG: response regulator [Deltaproteobacteria bacterium]|nr:response regulator [Deltaproteobacteria bacterium]
MVKANILLVDDEIPFVKTVTKRLLKRGMNSLSAGSGEEALARLEDDADIEIVILDIKMPGVDGLEILAEIKRNYPLVEVIILTGDASVESAIKGMRLGAFDYLVKPCSVEELVSKIEEATDRKRPDGNGPV